MQSAHQRLLWLLTLLLGACAPERLSCTAHSAEASSCRAMYLYPFDAHRQCVRQPQILNSPCAQKRLAGATNEGRFPICMVNPQGELYVGLLDGSQTIMAGVGWSHSGYGGQLPVASTLSAEDQERCEAALGRIPWPENIDVSERCPEARRGR